MSSSIDADIEQVAQVAQALDDISLESSYQANHSADAVPKSTSTPDRVVGVGGDLQARVRAMYKMIAVYVERQFDGKLVTKRIKFQDLAAYESDGWVQWFPRARRTVPTMDEDHRMAEEINDVLTPSEPYKATANIISREIEHPRAGDNMAWVEGPMGDAKILFRVRQLSALNSVEDNRTKVTLSVERQVDGKLETKKIEVVTPAAHEYDGWVPSLPWFPAPEGVCADWGGYDTFYEWQVNGRAVNEDWVSQYDPDWRNKVAEPMRLVGDDGNEEVIHYSDDSVKAMQERAAELKTVHEKLWG
ncbi:hypothetical protein FPRO04_08379 [Fusarium proliferatum]|nr:hypothetical protein FPRO03_04299 [Fusarium proliferatum]KAG4275466.1 hypothetical protein FPRO04_08379 [Fusarium proliferatum]